ncbi:MAG: hypothetical protein ACLFN0_04210 [Thermovirgaceae bacterium]
MCQVITPDSSGMHGHVEDPLSIAELLRETLSEELQAMNNLSARWHMVEDDVTTHALEHLIAKKREMLRDLWDLLRDVEARAFAPDGHSHGHGHSRNHTHTQDEA